MNCLLDATNPDIEAAAHRIITSESFGQLLPLFFEMLWRKQGRDAKTGKLIEHVLDPDTARVADAIVIQRGRPIQWYFSSLRENGVLLAKQRKNVTAESIVDHFLAKKHLSVSGICAQFIEPCETSRQGVTSTFISTENFQVWLSTLPSGRSGILHRFLDPLLSPGASQNWEVSCLWTPSALDAERVETSKELRDRTISPQLRCDVHLPEVSSTKRLVCGRHVAMVDECCRAIADHVFAISGRKTQISSLELQCKVGPNDHLVILYPRRMVISVSNPAFSIRGKNTLEVGLPCVLPVKIPLEYQKVNTSSSSLALNGSNLSQNNSNNRKLNDSSFNQNDISNIQNNSSSIILSTLRQKKGKNNKFDDDGDDDEDCGGFNFSSLLAQCIVCKRHGSAVIKHSILIPLKHVLLSLEVISGERQKNNAQSNHIIGEVPLHVSMLFPNMNSHEYLEKKKNFSVWGEEKVDVCKECSTALQEAVKK